jgi:hypothetical protein
VSRVTEETFAAGRIYASGLTPLRLSSRIAADHGDPWYACGYLVATVVLSAGATVLLKTKSTPDSR